MDDAMLDFALEGTENCITTVLDAAYNELKKSRAADNDLDNIFWSSVHTTADSCKSDSLDSIFYDSLINDDNWTPRKEEISSYDPPSGDPVIASAPEAVDKETLIDQVAEVALRELDNLLPQSKLISDIKGGYLLFSDGDDKVFVGKPNQFGLQFDNPKEQLKSLLGKFYRGDKKELEHVAQHIVGNALNGTPVDIKKWLSG
ncbi:MAG: hypothetical protein FWD27_07405 [Coriobacteriia bacterium]|nr:hypothetical protein [Coriobacteriia bacterium]